jgi:hypothetical protein
METEALLYKFLISEKEKQNDVLYYIGTDLYNRKRYKDANDYFTLAGSEGHVNSQMSLDTLIHISDANIRYSSVDPLISIVILGVISMNLIIANFPLLFIFSYFGFLYEISRSVRNYIKYLYLNDILEDNMSKKPGKNSNSDTASAATDEKAVKTPRKKRTTEEYIKYYMEKYSNVNGENLDLNSESSSESESESESDSESHSYSDSETGAETGSGEHSKNDSQEDANVDENKYDTAGETNTESNPEPDLLANFAPSSSEPNSESNSNSNSDLDNIKLPDICDPEVKSDN